MKLLTFAAVVLFNSFSAFAETKSLVISPLEISSAPADHFTSLLSPRTYDSGDWDFYINTELAFEVHYTKDNGRADTFIIFKDFKFGPILVPKGSLKTDFSDEDRMVIDLSEAEQEIRSRNTNLNITAVELYIVNARIFEDSAYQDSLFLWGDEVEELSLEGGKDLQERNSSVDGEHFKFKFELIDSLTQDN